MKTILDVQHRVVIPKAVRQALSVKPGTAFTISCQDDLIVLRPIRSVLASVRKDLRDSAQGMDHNK